MDAPERYITTQAESLLSHATPSYAYRKAEVNPVVASLPEDIRIIRRQPEELPPLLTMHPPPFTPGALVLVRNSRRRD